jgi:hypothetical protein
VICSALLETVGLFAFRNPADRRLRPSLSKETAMIEYRVKRVERYIVTRYEEGMASTTGSIRQIGNEYDSFDVAYEVGYALARADQERLGPNSGDMGVIFPRQSLEDARA